MQKRTYSPFTGRKQRFGKCFVVENSTYPAGVWTHCQSPALVFGKVLLAFPLTLDWFRLLWGTQLMNGTTTRNNFENSKT